MNKLADYIAELVLSQFEGRKPAPVPEEIDLNNLCEVSAAAHMNYLILGGLLKADNLPGELIAPLRGKVMQSVTQTLAQVNDLKAIIRNCEEAGVDNQPMKGSWLKFIYPSPEMREMSDIDILFREERMAEADKILTGLGYKKREEVHHHDIYVKPVYMMVEAHRAMYDKEVDQNQYEYYKNMSRAKLVEGYHHTYNFGDEDFYVYMISHMAKHFYTRGCGIRNLLDIYVFLKQRGEGLDRPYTDKELDKLGLLSFTKEMEELAFVWMEKKEGTRFQQQLFDYMLDGGIYGKDENGIWSRFAQEQSGETAMTRKKLKKWYFFPPYDYMVGLFPWLEGKKILLPWAWVVRGVRGIFERRGTQKREMIDDIDPEQIETCMQIYKRMDLHFK